MLKPGGVVSSLGVYPKDLCLPMDDAAWGGGLADKQICCSLCPGGKDRMHRLINVVQSKRVDLLPMITHRFKVGDIRSFASPHPTSSGRIYRSGINPSLTSSSAFPLMQLDDIKEAYHLFSNQLDGVIKVAIVP